MNIKRGDIVYVQLPAHPNSCVQSGLRPCLVLSNNISNKCNIVNVVPLSKKIKRSPVHVVIDPIDVNGWLQQRSDLLMEQITTVDKRFIISKIAHIPENSAVMYQICAAVRRQLLLDEAAQMVETGC